MARTNKKLAPAAKAALVQLKEPSPGFYGKLLQREDIVREQVTLEAPEFTRLRRIGLGNWHY